MSYFTLRLGVSKRIAGNRNFFHYPRYMGVIESNCVSLFYCKLLVGGAVHRCSIAFMP